MIIIKKYSKEDIMTNKENALVALRGGVPESVPCFYSSCQIMIVDGFGDIPPFTSGVPGCDKYGVHQTPTESAGGMFTPTSTVPPVLTDITKWKEQVTLPDLDEVDWKSESKKDFEILHTDRKNFVQDLFCCNGIFERLHFMMGFENALCAIMEEPEAVYDFVGTLADIKIKAIGIAAKYYKPDVFTYLDDYSHINGLMISPSIFRKIFKPHLKRIFDAINKTDMIAKFHCCGKMEQLAEDFVEIGAKALDPCQPCNDVAAIKKRVGNTCIVGGLDVQHVIDVPEATEEAIRAEVRRCIDTYAGGGHYIPYAASLSLYDSAAYAPGGVIGNIIDECAKYGKDYYKI
jgi:hypothetical protein